LGIEQAFSEKLTSTQIATLPYRPKSNQDESDASNVGKALGTDVLGEKIPKPLADLRAQVTDHKGALYPVKSVSIVSSARATATSVAPEYGELWSKLDAEIRNLSDPVLTGLSEQTITWKRAGIEISEEIAQITYGGSPEMQLKPSDVFKSFANSELDRRRSRKYAVHKWIGHLIALVVGLLSGGVLSRLLFGE
jgi:hypothetical protein